jgi:hypothetical protein
VLQLALAGMWLLDGMLQYQSFMFSRAFGQMLAGTAAGNPSVVAWPIIWDAGLIARHGVLRRRQPGQRRPRRGGPLRAARGAAVAGEPRRGGPVHRGARRGGSGRPAVWLVLWLSLAYFALLPGNRAPQALHDMIAGMADGQPGWLAALVDGAASLVGHQGLAASIVLATALALGYWPARAAPADRVARDARINGVRALAGGHCAPHLIHAAAMLYMFLAFATPAGRPGTGGMGGRDLPFLALLFGLALIGYTVWDLDQLAGPRAATGCRIAMGVTMSFMLLIMV